MNKYSQSGQDDWVLNVIGNYGYFADWGAYDGVLYSNTLRLEEAGWEGICIEGNLENYKKLVENRKCICVPLAISTGDHLMRMSNEGSSSQRVFMGGKLVFAATIKDILIDCKSPKYIDYISSDLERMDAEIWESFPFNEYSFGLATVEHCLYEGSSNFKERIMKVMLDNGYLLAKENVEHDSNKYEDWYKNSKLM